MNWEETQDQLRQRVKAQRGAGSEIARRLGVSRATVAEYLSGERTIPSGHVSVILSVLHLELELIDRPQG